MSRESASFADCLRHLRQSAGLSQMELANRAGVSLRGISDLERGVRRAPHLTTVRLLADALELDDADRQLLLAAARPGRVLEMQAGARAGVAALPTPLTSLVGRERELAALLALLGAAETRLVTLTGAGGIGKTRLAIAVAERLAGDFADGVWFVGLAPVTDPTLVASCIAQILGVREAGREPLVDRLQAFLREKHLLLVLDNFEQVVEAAPLVTDLLWACSAVKVLVTSRVRLRVSGEHEFVAPPLGLAEPDAPTTSESVRASEAVLLFVARAQAVREDFALTAENAAAVARICQRLDGLPLAIELAAPRIKVLPPKALLARLEPQLPLLTGGGRDAPARQRTMRDAIAWSYDLLTAPEQTLFRRLAVFVGGFSLEAAEAVAATPGNLELDPITGIASLVDTSLLQQQRGLDDEPRYTMLETIREFGLEQLSLAGEEEETRARHADYFHRLSAGLAHGIRTDWSLDAKQRVAAERDNVRLALAWCDEHEAFDALLQLCTMLFAVWSGPAEEGLAWVERALERSGHIASAARVQALQGAGILALFQEDYDRAAVYFAEHLALARELDDAFAMGVALLNAGHLANRRGDYEAVQAPIEEGLGLLREEVPTNPAAVLYTVRGLLILGDTALSQEQSERAADWYTQALALAPATGMDWGLSDIQAGLAGASSCRGEVARAATLYAESLARTRHALVEVRLAHVQDRSYTPLLLSALFGLAGIAAETGNAEQGARLFGAAEAITASHGISIFPRDRPIRERSLSALRTALGTERLAATRAAGHALTIEQAVAEAMGAAEAVSESAAAAPDHGRLDLQSRSGLTPRELEVLQLVAAGRSNPDIADALFLSRRTVTTHLTHIFAKLGVQNRAEAAAHAHTHHLV